MDLRLSVSKAASTICNLLILTTHVMVSSLLLPPPPPTSEGATLGAETNKQMKQSNMRWCIYFLALQLFTTKTMNFFLSLGDKSCTQDPHIIITMAHSSYRMYIKCFTAKANIDSVP